MRWSQNPLLKFFSSAVLDQAILSAASFGVGLLLIRHTSDRDYGHYVLAQTAILLLISIHGAILGSPLLVTALKRDEAARRDMVGSLNGQHRRLLGRAAAVTMLAGLALAGGFGLDTALILLGGAFVVTAYTQLRRDFFRTVNLVYMRPQILLSADVLYVSVLLVGVLFAVFIGNSRAAFWALLALGAAAVAGSWPIDRSLARSPGWSGVHVTGIWREMLPLGMWASVGAMIYWTQSQGYNYLLAAKLDVSAVAAVAATRLLMQPVNLLTTGVKSLLIPMSSRWQTEGGMRLMMRNLALFSAGLGLLALIYELVLWLLRDWVLHTVLKKSIAGFDGLLLAWMVVVLLSLVRDMFQSALLIRERFRVLAVIAALSAVVSIGVIWYCLGSMGPAGALLGVVVGEIVNLAGVLLVAVLELRKDTR